jgi:hydroxymethylbilane synthase
MPQKIRVGTRGSPLAMAQTHMVVEALRRSVPELDIEIVEILTSGDWKPADGEKRLLESAGGKGLFAHEIEQQILSGKVDCGVHSLKDMPSFLPEGLVIEHFLPREDPRDAFISAKYETFAGLPDGAVVGTSSLRRQAFLLAKRPGLRVVPLRGNVATRLEKLRAGQVDATFLAYAGLKRLGLDEEKEIRQVLSPEEFLPACGQGIIGIETRKGDAALHETLQKIHDTASGLRAVAERAVLQVLDGSCRTPVGSYATMENGRMRLCCAVAMPDGSKSFEAKMTEPVSAMEDAENLGRKLGEKLKPDIPEGLLQG